MSSTPPTLLLVSNSDDRPEIEALLADAALGEVHFAAGGDSTLGVLDGLAPEVVILTADLDQGDARSFATAVREAEFSTAIVLIGQESGPIRNALDASDFEVDHFIGRPIAAKALLYAVRTGIDSSRKERGKPGEEQSEELKTLSDSEIVSRAQTQSKIGAAMDEAIDAFVDEAIAAIPETNPGFDPNDDGVVEEIASDLDTQQQAIPTAAHDDPTGRIPGAEMLHDAELAEPIEAQPGEDTLAPAEWREETMVLSGGGSSAATAAAPAAETGELSAGSPFARELRKKMSKMAERLFPGEQDPMELGVSHGAHTEIDLSSLERGNTSIHMEGDFDEQHTLSGVETQVPDAFSDTGTNPRIRREPTSPRMRHAIDAQGHDVASTLARFFDLGVTGRVTFRGGGAEKTIYLDRGRPAFASSSLPHDRMGDLLYREGKLTRAQHIRSRELVGESGKRMGEVLVAEGFLKPSELMPAVRRHLEDLIYSLFAWDEGAYEVVEEVVPSTEQIQLSRHPAALIAEGVRRKYDLSRLLRVLGSDNPVIEMTEAERVNALCQQIDLLPAELRVVELVNGRTPLHEIADRARSDLLTAAQVVFSLVALGAADVVNETVTEHEVTIDNSSPEAEGNEEIDRQRIYAKYELIVQSDYFRLLGVRRDATSFEIRRAYERAARDFEPSTFAIAVQRDLAHELVEIDQVLAEAVAILADDRIREAYLSNLGD